MTLARRRGFDSRATCGLRAPRSISRNVDASRGGVAKHYNGPPTRLSKASPHTACRSFWRGVQSHHMGGNGWADVAYTLAVCPHGIVLAGRGGGIRTAAQGTVIGNDRYYAIFHLVGGDERPSVEMLEASAWCVRELRRLGAGREVRPHWFFRPTSCPGKHIPTDEHNRDIPSPDLEAIVAASMLTRIDGSTAVYQIVGQFLIALTKPEQAALVVQHAELEEGRAVDIVESGAWRDHIKDMTPNEASHFTVINRLSDLHGPSTGLSRSEADALYAPTSHGHRASVELS